MSDIALSDEPTNVEKIRGLRWSLAETVANMVFVQLTFLEENDESTIDEQYGHTVLNIIYEVLEKKHLYKDICILVRGNREGVKLANFLSQEKSVNDEIINMKMKCLVRFVIFL